MGEPIFEKIEIIDQALDDPDTFDHYGEIVEEALNHYKDFLEKIIRQSE